MSTHPSAAADEPTDPAHPAADRAIRAAQAVLHRRLGAKVELAALEDLGGSARSTVLRVRVMATPFVLPPTLVVKHYGSRHVAATGSFASEAVSYQLFTALREESRTCPELFAHGAEEQVLVLQDLGRVPTLRDALLGHDAKVAERALLSFARSLGVLHASTAHREADFDALVRRIGVTPAPDPVQAMLSTAVRTVPGLLCERLRIPPSKSGRACAHRALRRLQLGDLRAFTPVDLCPENNLLTDKGVRFLDFEGGRMRNVLLDAAYLLIPFPSCKSSYSLPAGMSEAMLASWRAEVLGVWPELLDERTWRAGLVDAALLWMWMSTAQRLPNLLATRDAATGTNSSALAALAVRWHGMAEHAQLCGSHEVAEHCGAVTTALQHRMGALSVAALPETLYPAFTAA
ncbi:MAG: hypothetical protein ACRDRL_30480 [Sciscionella sp.]